MAFWNTAAGAEPLRQFRWYITFGGTGKLDDAQYALKKCDKPKLKIGTVQHKFLNHYFNYPGRLEWQDVKVTFAAMRANDSGKRLYEMLAPSGYAVPTGPTDRKTISKYELNTQLGAAIKLTQIGANGTDSLDEWTLNNAFFTDVDFGTLDYGTDEIVEITCTIKYDYATLSHPEAAAPATRQ